MPTSERAPDFLDGRVLRSAELPGLTLGEIEYSSRCERARHVHTRACLHFLLLGGYTEYHNGHSTDCGTFTLSFLPAGHEHSYRGADAPTRSLTIEFDDEWLSQLRAHSVTLDTPLYLTGGIESLLIARLYNEFRRQDTCSPLIIEALAIELAAEASRRNRLNKKPPPWLNRVTDLLHDRFSESLSLQSIAASVAVHPVHLARVFRQHHRCSVGDYLRRLRIDFASRQMMDSDLPIVEIALTAGFSDQSQFSNTFKRLVGLTPARFRAEMRAR